MKKKLGISVKKEEKKAIDATKLLKSSLSKESREIIESIRRANRVHVSRPMYQLPQPQYIQFK